MEPSLDSTAEHCGCRARISIGRDGVNELANTQRELISRLKRGDKTAAAELK